MKQDLSHFAVIVAGGTGTRMKSDKPKQFHTLGRQPVIVHTVQRFTQANPGINIIIVVHPAWFSHLQEIIQEHLPGIGIKIATGGDTRFQSVKNGLAAITATEGKVAIHDAVRPLVKPEVIRKGMERVHPGTGVVPAVEPKDSVRKMEGGTSRGVNRTAYRLVQTPQCFMLSDLRAAYNQPYDPSYTDDASVLEKFGMKIEIIAGNEENIKITGPLDMKIAELLLKEGLD